MATVPTPFNSARASDETPGFPCMGINFAPTNDVDTFDQPTTIYVGTTGDVAVRPWADPDGNTVTNFVGFPAGQCIPVRVRGVNQTDTTAGGLVAIY